MFSLALILAFLFLALSGLARTVNYCDPSLCTYNDIVKHHIGCDNNGKFGSECKEPAIIEITQKMQNSILFWHNDYRNKVANGSLKGFTSAKRMTTVTWDDELAYLAKLNVLTCKLEHDECHNTNEYKYSGQNVAMRYQSADITHSMYECITVVLIKEWFNEYEKANQIDVDKCTESGLSKGIGHFTAMIQEKSGKIGCALARFTEVLLGDNFYAILFTCNYSFTNVIGMPIYVKGPMGSACETGTNPNFNGLCSLAEYVPPVRFSFAVNLPVSEHPAYNPEPLYTMKADLGPPLPRNHDLLAVDLLTREDSEKKVDYPMITYRGDPPPPIQVLDAVNLSVSEHPAYNRELYPMLWRGDSYKRGRIRRHHRRGVRRTTVVKDEWPFSNLTNM